MNEDGGDNDSNGDDSDGDYELNVESLHDPYIALRKTSCQVPRFNG